MTACNIIETLITVLSKNDGLSDIEFIREFPTIKKDTPLKAPTVTVGVDKVFMTCVDQAVKIGIDKAPTTIRAKLMLCVPKRYSGTDCYSIVDRIIAGLDDFTNDYYVTRIETGELKYGSSLGVLAIPISVTFSTEMVTDT